MRRITLRCNCIFGSDPTIVNLDMKKYRCYIVDDEPLAIQVIEQHLLKFPEFEVIGKCTEPLAALAEIKVKQPDLLIIDIQMPDITGLEFIETLQHRPSIVITTAYRDYAVQAFEINVLDYLVKPVSIQRFMKTIEKFLDSQLPGLDSSGATAGFLLVRSERKMVRVRMEDIYYVEGIKDYVRIVMPDQRLLTKGSIGTFLERLPADRFMRIHKSYVVALPLVETYSADGIEIDGHLIPLGRSYRPSFLRRMEGE